MQPSTSGVGSGEDWLTSAAEEVADTRNAGNENADIRSAHGDESGFLDDARSAGGWYAGGDSANKLSADSSWWPSASGWSGADSVRSAGGQSANVDPPSMWNHASGAADWSWWSG